MICREDIIANVAATAVDVPNEAPFREIKTRTINTVRIMAGDEARARQILSALGTGHVFRLGGDWGVDGAGWDSVDEAHDAGCRGLERVRGRGRVMIAVEGGGSTAVESPSCAICGEADNPLKRSPIDGAARCDWRTKPSHAPDGCCVCSYRAESPIKGGWARCERRGLAFMPEGKGCYLCRGECGGGYAESEKAGGMRCPRRWRGWGGAERNE